MKNHKFRNVRQADLESITCDKCKKTIDNDIDIQESYSISFMVGYTSVFGDLNQVDCDLCQECLYELIGKFCIYNNNLGKDF